MTAFLRAHFGSIPIRDRVEISIGEPQYPLDARAWRRFTFPTSRRRTDFPTSRFTVSGWRTFLSAPLRRKENSLERLTPSHRGAPLHPGADQTA